MRRALVLVMTMTAITGWSRAASAQPQAVGAQPPLARFITDLIAAGGRVDSTHVDERTDFILGSQLAGTPALLNQSLGLQLASFPYNLGLDTSKPGSEFVPGHAGFGPAFTVHAGSMGRGRVSVSFNYQNTSFGSLDGTALDSGQLGFVLKPPPGVQAQFGRDVLHESVLLRFQQDVATFGVVYGVFDRLDIGVAIPIVHIEAEGQVQSHVYTAAGTINPDRFFFDTYPAAPSPAVGCSVSSVDVAGINRSGLGTEFQPLVYPFNAVELASRTVARRCGASGIGDVVLHSRWRLADTVAAGLDARLPTGNKDQLLGTGATQTTVALVWSTRTGRVMPHANIGYTVSRGNSSAFFNTVGDNVPSPTPLALKVPNELDVAGGADIVFFRRLTTGIDVFARKVQDLRRFRVDNSTAAALAPSDPQVPGTLLSNAGLGALLLVGVGSAQVALTDRTVLMANILFPLGGGGLRPQVGLSAGLGVRY